MKNENITVVLMRPETEGNIGAVARAMKNFGFEKLLLVDPCDIGTEARNRAKHARDILDDAVIEESMDWEGFDIVISTSSETGGRYNILRNALGPCDIKEKISDVKGSIALVFGPESKGLNNDEVKKTDLLCHIPANSEYPVFNLSHATAIILYELSKAEGDGSYELASHKEREVLMDQLKDIVDSVDVEDYRYESLKFSFKNILGRSMISRKEASVLIGFFRKVKEKIK